MNENKIASEVIGAAIEVHKALGIGLSASTYFDCIEYELESRGIFVERNVAVPIFYKNRVINAGTIIPILVENKVIVELKFINRFCEKDILCMKSNLYASDLKLGLMINFDSKFIKGDAIKRVVNGLIDENHYNQNPDNIDRIAI